jgi:hypothetical protein
MPGLIPLARDVEILLVRIPVMKLERINALGIPTTNAASPEIFNGPFFPGPPERTNDALGATLF